MPQDRSMIVSARRGGQTIDDAGELQERYAEDVRSDMARAGLTTNSLSKAIGIKPGTLKGYLDGTSPWPVGVIKGLARILGRSSDADLVALGYVSSPMAQQFLRQQQQLRLADLVQNNTALLVPREPLTDSPGAQLAATLVRSPDHGAADIDIRLRLLMRGVEHPMPFAELLILDLPRDRAADYAAVRQQLLNTRISSLPGKASATFGNALDYYGAMFEGSLDHMARLRRQFSTSDAAALIIVPRLLATRPLDPLRLSPAFEHLDGVAVTSMYFGGSPDVAALAGDPAGWGYASVGKLTQQTFGTALTRHGGHVDDSDPTADRTFHLHCQELTELLLNPSMSGRRRASSLDEPADALAVISRLSASNVKLADDARSPLVMLRISSERLRWAANRWAVNRRGRDAWGDDTAVAEHNELVALQDELTIAVEAVPNRPVAVFELPESNVDYNDREKDTADADLDTFVVTAERLQEWMLGLGA